MKSDKMLYNNTRRAVWNVRPAAAAIEMYVVFIDVLVIIVNHYLTSLCNHWRETSQTRRDLTQTLDLKVKQTVHGLWRAAGRMQTGETSEGMLGPGLSVGENVRRNVSIFMHDYKPLLSGYKIRYLLQCNQRLKWYIQQDNYTILKITNNMNYITVIVTHLKHTHVHTHIHTVIILILIILIILTITILGLI